MSSARRQPPSVARRSAPITTLWWRNGWCRFAIAAIILVVVHLPFILNTRKDTPQAPTPQPTHRKEVSTILNQDAWEKDFQKWLAIVNPWHWYLGDYHLGFSQVNILRRHSALPDFPAYIAPTSAPATHNVVPKALELSHSTAAINNYWELYQPEFLPPPPAPTQHKVRWRRKNGRELRQAPVIPDDILQHWEESQKAGIIRDVTTLQITFTTAMPIPRIILRGSCGDQQLDQAAIRAVRDYLRQLPQDDTYSGTLWLEADWFH